MLSNRKHVSSRFRSKDGCASLSARGFLPAFRVLPACAVLTACIVLAGCAATDGGSSGSGSDPWADSGPRRGAPTERTAGSPSAPAAVDDPGPPSETTKPAGKVEWVAVYESPPEARYSDQRVIYVDRNSVESHRLENLTYYLARTREVSRSGAKPKIQELAVLCEGAPSAPATALRGEGTEESGGSYSLKRAATPLTSVSQFSTQRVRAEATNPNTFIVRAVCVLGTGG